MNTELQTFAFHSHQLTVITDEQGNPWFIAKEVAEILEYKDTEAMTRKLDDEEVQNLQIVGFGNRGINIINESGLWSAVLRSTKPEAKAVKKWITSEVMPSIRKTGSYGGQDALKAIQDDLNKARIEIGHKEAYWFKKYPHWRTIRQDYYLGYPFSYIARIVDKSASACCRAVKRMEVTGLINPRYAAFHRLPDGAYRLWLLDNSRVGW